MKRILLKRILSLSVVLMLAAALIAVTVVFSTGDTNKNISGSLDNAEISSSVGDTAVSGGNFSGTSSMSTVTGAVPSGYTPSGSVPISNGTGFRNVFYAEAGTSDIATTAYLTSDITLTAAQFGSLAVFSGTFDGNGHTITINENVTYSSAQGITSLAANISGAGMFGRRNSGTIKNLTVIVNGTISMTHTAAFSVGLIAGWNTGTIANTHVIINGALTFSDTDDLMCGVFVGTNGGDGSTGYLKNCKTTLNGSLNVNNSTQHLGVGGMVGWANMSSLSYCHIDGSGSFNVNSGSGWRFAGLLVGANRNGGMNEFPASSSACSFEKPILSFYGTLNMTAAPENYFGLIIGVGAGHNYSATYYTNYTVDTPSAASGNGAHLNTAYAAQALPGNLYVEGGTASSSFTRVRVNAADTTLGVAWDVGTNSASAVTARWSGWDATGVSGETSGYGSFNTAGSYVEVGTTAGTYSWTWLSTNTTKTLGDVSDGYRAEGIPIATGAQFAAVFGKAGGTVVDGDYYLTNDITLDSYVGSGAIFKGIFDGNGYTVTVNSTAITSNYYSTSATLVAAPAIDVSGLVAAKNEGTIANVKLKIAGNVKFATAATAAYDATSYLTTSGGRTVRTLVGGIAGWNAGKISNVKLIVDAGADLRLYMGTTTTAGPGGIGGIAGVLKGTSAIINGAELELNGTFGLSEGHVTTSVGVSNPAISAITAGAVNGTLTNVALNGTGTFKVGAHSGKVRFGILAGIDRDGGFDWGDWIIGGGTSNGVTYGTFAYAFRGNFDLKNVGFTALAWDRYPAATGDTGSGYFVGLLSTWTTGTKTARVYTANVGTQATTGAFWTSETSVLTVTQIDLTPAHTRYDTAYNGGNSFVGLTAHFDAASAGYETDGVSGLTDPDNMVVDATDPSDIKVNVSISAAGSYSWTWDEMVVWTEIDTGTDFLNFLSNNTVFTGNARLNADITLSGASLSSIIINDSAAVFEGQNHTIVFNGANSLAAVAIDTYGYAGGLFGAGVIAAVNKGTIRNVSIRINGSLTVADNGNGVIVGGIAGVNMGTIVNSMVTVTADASFAAGTTGSATPRDVVLGGVAGVLDNAVASIYAPTVQIDGRLEVNSLAGGGYAVVGGVVGVYAHATSFAYAKVLGGGKIGVSATANSANYVKFVGGLYGTARDALTTTRIQQPGNTTYDRTVNNAIFLFSGSLLKAGAGNAGDLYGAAVGIGPGGTIPSTAPFFIYTATNYVAATAASITSFSNGEHALSGSDALFGANQKYTLRQLYLTADKADITNDYSPARGTATMIIAVYAGSEFAVGLRAGAINAEWNATLSVARLFTNGDTIASLSNSSAPVTFVWDEAEYDGATATGETYVMNGSHTSVAMVSYNSGWATDYGRLLSGYGVPTSATAISTEAGYREWLALAPNAAGYNYGYLTADIDVSANATLANSTTELASGRTFDGAGHVVSFSTTDWIAIPNGTTIESGTTLLGNTNKKYVGGGIVNINRGTIKNLTVKPRSNTTWHSNYTGAADSGICGGLTGINYGTVENCNMYIPSGSSFKFHKQGGNAATAANSYTVLGGLVGANIGGLVRYCSLENEGTLNAYNASSANTTGATVLGGVIGLQSGGISQYLIIKGSGLIDASSTTSPTNWYGGILGAFANQSSGATLSNGGSLSLSLAKSTLSYVYSGYRGSFSNGASARVGLIAGYATSSATFDASTNPRISGIMYYHTSGQFNWIGAAAAAGTQSFNAVSFFGGNSTTEQTNLFTGGRVAVAIDTTHQTAGSYYNCYFDYWTNDGYLGVEFSKPTLLSSQAVYFNVAGNETTSNTVAATAADFEDKIATEARFVVKPNFMTRAYSGNTKYSAFISVGEYQKMSDALNYGSLAKSGRERVESGTRVSSGTTFPLSGTGNYYMTEDITINLSQGSPYNNSYGGTLYGNGYTLTINLALGADTNGGFTSAGGVVSTLTGTIRDLKVVVNSSGSGKFLRQSDNTYAGSYMVGKLNGGTIDNVNLTVRGSLTIYNGGNWNSQIIAGMMVGEAYNSGTISNCCLNIDSTAALKIDGWSGSGLNPRPPSSYAGGFVGRLTSGSISNCLVTGGGLISVSYGAGARAGLIAGELSGAATETWLWDCTTTGSGGITGLWVNGSGTSVPRVYLTGTQDSSNSFISKYHNGSSQANVTFTPRTMNLGTLSSYINPTQTTTVGVTGGDQTFNSSTPSLYMDRSVVNAGNYLANEIVIARNGQRGFFFWSIPDVADTYYTGTKTKDQWSSISQYHATGYTIGQRGVLKLVDGQGNIMTSDVTASKLFDGSKVVTSLNPTDNMDTTKYAYTYQIYDYSGNTILSWTRHDYDDFSREIYTSSANVGTYNNITKDTCVAGYYFLDTTSRFVPYDAALPKINYTIRTTTLLASPTTSPNWSDAQNVAFIIPRGEEGSIVKLSFFTSAAMTNKKIADKNCDTYEYGAYDGTLGGLNYVFENQSDVGGSQYYVVAYYAAPDTSTFKQVAPAKPIRVLVDTADPVITLGEVSYSGTGANLTATMRITVNDVSELTYELLSEPNGAANTINNFSYGTYDITFTETANYTFTVADSLGREAYATFLIDTASPIITAAFNTSTFAGSSGDIEYINSNNHKINITGVSDNYADSIYLRQNIYWQILDMDNGGHVLYESNSTTANFSNNVITLALGTNFYCANAKLRLWVRDTVGNMDVLEKNLLIDTRQYKVYVNGSLISKEGNPGAFSQRPSVTVTYGVTGSMATISSYTLSDAYGTYILLSRYDRISLANPYTNAGFSYVGFGVDVDRARVSSNADINLAYESIDTGVGVTDFVIDGENRSGVAMGTSLNLVAFYTLQLSVAFGIDTTINLNTYATLDTSTFIGAITRTSNGAAARIATEDYINISVFDENNVAQTGTISGTVEGMYTIIFDIKPEYSLYYTMDSTSATYVLSIVDPTKPVVNFSQPAAIGLTYDTVDADYGGNWAVSAPNLGWKITGVDGLVDRALRSGNLTMTKTQNGSSSAYTFAQLYSDYPAFLNEIRYTVKYGSENFSGEYVKNAGSYYITLLIPSGKSLIGSTTITVTIAKKTVHGYAFSQQTIYGYAANTSAYFVNWSEVHATDRAAVSKTYSLDADGSTVYYTDTNGTSIIVGTYNGTSTSGTLYYLGKTAEPGFAYAATRSGNSLSVAYSEFAPGTYTYLPVTTGSQRNVGSYSGGSGVIMSAGSLANYSFINTVAPSLSIVKRSITVEISNITKGYNTADPASFSWDLAAGSSFGYTDGKANFATNLSRVPGELVDHVYPITGTVTNGNYDVTVVSGSLTVVHLTLRYMITGTSGLYCDDSDHFGGISATITNAKQSDLLTASVVYRIGWQSDGVTPIFVAVDTSAAVGSQYTVYSGSTTLSYNSTTGKYTFTGKNKTDGAVGTYNIEWIEAGNYVYRIIVGTDGDLAGLSNYAYDNSLDRIVTIASKIVTVVLLDQTIRYGGRIETTGEGVAYKLQGVPQGESFTSFSINIKTDAKNVGQYPSGIYNTGGVSYVSASGATYSFSIVFGNLTIEKKTLGLSWVKNYQTVTYDGTDQKNNYAATIVSSDFATGDRDTVYISGYKYYNASGAEVTGVVNVGGYKVQAILDGANIGNYMIDPDSEYYYVIIDKKTATFDLLGVDYNEKAPTNNYKVFNSTSKATLFAKSNFVTSNTEAMTDYCFNNSWEFVIFSSNNLSYSDQKYIGYNNLPATFVDGTYEVYVYVPETPNYYATGGRMIFCVMSVGATVNNGNGVHVSAPTKTVSIKSGINNISFANGNAGYVAGNWNSPAITLSSSKASIGNGSGGKSCEWLYFYINIELTPEVYMAQQNGNLSLSVAVTGYSSKYVYNAWNYNNSDGTYLIVREMPTADYYGAGALNEGQISSVGRTSAASQITNWGKMAVNQQIHGPDSRVTYTQPVSSSFSSSSRNSSYRIYLLAYLHDQDSPTGANYSGMNVSFFGLSVTATVNDSTSPYVDTTTDLTSTGGTGIRTMTSKSIASTSATATTQTYYNNAKFYQFSVKDAGVGINPYSFKLKLSNNTVWSVENGMISATRVAGDYRSMLFLTPILSSSIVAIKSIEVEDFVGNKLLTTYSGSSGRVDNLSPTIGSMLSSNSTATFSAAYDEGIWHVEGTSAGASAYRGEYLRFTVIDPVDANSYNSGLNAGQTELYYYNGTTKQNVSLSVSNAAGVYTYTSDTALNVNTKYYIYMCDAQGNRTTEVLYYHMDPQSETSTPPLTIDLLTDGVLGSWNSRPVTVTASVGGMGAGLGKVEYLATDTDVFAAGTFASATYASDWRALSLSYDGVEYTSSVTFSRQQSQYYVFRFVTEAGNVVYKNLGKIMIDSITPQLFATINDIDGNLAESGKWVKTGLVFNITGSYGLSGGVLQYSNEGYSASTWYSTETGRLVYNTYGAYFRATLTISNTSVSSANYALRFVPGGGGDPIYLEFAPDIYNFVVNIDNDIPIIAAEATDWQSSQTTAVIHATDRHSGIASIRVVELNGEGEELYYYSVDGAYHMDGSVKAGDSRTVLFESGEYKFSFGNATYVIHAIDNVGLSASAEYVPQVDVFRPEITVGIIQYQSIDEVGFVYHNLAGTAAVALTTQSNFIDYGISIGNYYVLFAMVEGVKRVAFAKAGATFNWSGTNYTSFGSTSDTSLSGATAGLSANGITSVYLYPSSARIRLVAAGGAEYHGVDGAHSYTSGTWTTKKVRLSIIGLVVGKSGGTLYYSNNGVSDIASDWTAIYSADTYSTESTDLSNNGSYIELSEDMSRSFTFRFISLSGIRVYYNFATGAAEEYNGDHNTAGQYTYVVNIDSTPPEIYNVECRTAQGWQEIGRLNDDVWYTYALEIRFKVSDTAFSSASSLLASVKRYPYGGSVDSAVDISFDGTYYSFTMDKTAGYTLLAEDNLGNASSYEITTKLIDVVPPTLVMSCTTDGAPYSGGVWTTKPVVFNLTVTNGVSGAVLQYATAANVWQTAGLVKISETPAAANGSITRHYTLSVSADTIITSYAFRLLSGSGIQVAPYEEVVVMLDQTAPIVNYTVIGSTPLPVGSEWTTSPVTLRLDIVETTSGVKAGTFTIAKNDGAPELQVRDGQGRYILEVADMSTYYIRVEDNAGNVFAPAEGISFNIDATPPSWGTTPVRAYTSYGTGSQADYTLSASNTTWAVSPLTLVFDVVFKAPASRAGYVYYSTDGNVWQELFDCALGENYVTDGTDNLYKYVFTEGAVLADYNGPIFFRAVSKSGIANAVGSDLGSYIIKVDRTVLSLDASYIKTTGEELATKWSDSGLNVSFDATWGLSGATLQVRRDAGSWSVIQTLSGTDTTVNDYPIAADYLNNGIYTFRLVKTADNSVLVETAPKQVLFDTKDVSIAVDAYLYRSDIVYAKGSWSGTGVSLKFTVSGGASIADGTMRYSSGFGNDGTWVSLLTTATNPLGEMSYTHADGVRDFAESHSGTGLETVYTVTFYMDVTARLLQTQYMFDVTAGNGRYADNTSYNTLNSIKIETLAPKFSLVEGEATVTVKNVITGLDYDYTWTLDPVWAKDNLRFTFVIRTYTSGGSLRYRVADGAYTDESVIRGTAVRGTETIEGVSYACTDTTYTFTVSSSSYASYRFAAESTAGVQTEYVSGATQAVFNVALDKNTPIMVAEAVTYYRDLSGGTAYDTIYGAPSGAYVSDAGGVKAVFSVADNGLSLQSGISSVTVTKAGEGVNIVTVQPDGSYAFIIRDSSVYTITISDFAGNSIMRTRQIGVDSVKPTLTVTPVGYGSYNESQFNDGLVPWHIEALSFAFNANPFGSSGGVIKYSVDGGSTFLTAGVATENFVLNSSLNGKIMFYALSNAGLRSDTVELYAKVDLNQYVINETQFVGSETGSFATVNYSATAPYKRGSAVSVTVNAIGVYSFSAYSVDGGATKVSVGSNTVNLSFVGGSTLEDIDLYLYFSEQISLNYTNLVQYIKYSGGAYGVAVNPVSARTATGRDISEYLTISYTQGLKRTSNVSLLGQPTSEYPLGEYAIEVAMSDANYVLTNPTGTVLTIEYFKESGAYNEPYLIDCEQDFGFVIARYLGEAKYFALARDITLNSDIKVETDFNANLDGKNYVLSLGANRIATGISDGGLFASISGLVSNLGIHYAETSVNVDVSAVGNNFGLLADTADGATFSNIYVLADLNVVQTGTSAATFTYGGLIGKTSGTASEFNNIYIDVSFNTYGVTASAFVGGVIGQSTVPDTLEGCYALTVVKAAANVTAGMLSGNLKDFGISNRSVRSNVYVDGIEVSNTLGGATQIDYASLLVGEYSNLPVPQSLYSGAAPSVLIKQLVRSRFDQDFIGSYTAVGDDIVFEVSDEFAFASINKYLWATYRQTDDFVVANATSIGKGADFRGSYDGNGHKISIDVTVDSGFALFDTVSGTLFDMNLADVNINATVSSDDDNIIAALVKNVVGGTVNGVVASGNLEFSSSSLATLTVGGLIGRVNGGTVKDVLSTIYMAGNAALANIGAIVGEAINSSVQNVFSASTVNVNIERRAAIGSVVGVLSGTTSLVGGYALAGNTYVRAAAFDTLVGYNAASGELSAQFTTFNSLMSPNTYTVNDKDLSIVLTALFANEFRGGGVGTSANPFVIETVEDYFKISRYMFANYIITPSGTTSDGNPMTYLDFGDTFETLGVGMNFTGTITGSSIPTVTGGLVRYTYAKLIGVTDALVDRNYGTISNLNIVAAVDKVMTEDGSFGVVANVNYGTVRLIDISGSIKVSSVGAIALSVAAVVGENHNGNITEIIVNAPLTAKGIGVVAGMIIGTAYGSGSVSKCSVECPLTVTANIAKAGYFVGLAEDPSIVDASNRTGSGAALDLRIK